jgi:Dolichyl-phosphate-mannose-protein mannosyltransferase
MKVVSGPFYSSSTRDHQVHTRWYATGLAVAALIVFLRLLLHLLTASRYGIFRDEMYYIACSRHLDWGYVDMPPFIPLMTRLFTAIFGTSLFVIRLIPAIAGCGAIALTGYQAYQLGGRRFGMALAALAMAVSPVFVINGHLLGTNDFEALFWMGCASVVIRIIQTGNQKLWLWFGVLAGLGMQNKYSMAVFGLGIVVGLLLTSERKAFAHMWIWIAGAIALLIFLPNLMWNVHRDWPFFQLMHNIRTSGRDVALRPIPFLLQQALMVNPFAFPLWVAGLGLLFFGREGRRYRVLGWAFVVTLGFFMTQHAKDYYVAPAYPMLLAAGSVCWEAWIERTQRAWLKPVFVLVLLVPALVLMPLIAPVMSPERFVTFIRAIHFTPPVSEHSHRRSPLPQYYSDELGWEVMVAEVARIYHSLPPDVQARTAIKASNFGEAGAIDYFGPKYGLPPAICFHQNYWYWGTHGYTGESIIVVNEGNEGRHLKQISEHAEKVGHFEYPYALENFDIWYAQGLKVSLHDIWEHEKNWD